MKKLEVKKCSRCKKELPLDCFQRRSENKDGLTYLCKSCIKLDNDKHREKLRETDRRSYKKNREKRVAKSSKYGYIQRGREVPQKVLENLPSPRKEVDQEEAYQNKLERVRKLKRENKEVLYQKYKEYCKTERGKLFNRLKSARYRTKKGDPLSLEDIKFLLFFQSNSCGSCGKKFSEKLKFEVDHIIPVSKGGLLTLENAQLLCRSCNASKRDKTIRYIPELSTFYSEVT